MDRLFGRSKPKAPAPSLTKVIAGAEARNESLQKKVDGYNAQLRKLNNECKSMRDGPMKKSKKQQMLQILRQKKAYEKQIMMTQQQAFNMDMQQQTIANLESTQAQVAAMAAGNKAMKAEYKKVDLNKVEDIQFEMEDLMQDSNEIQEILSESFAMPGIDEGDLDAELAELDDLDFDAEAAEANMNSELQVPQDVPSASFEAATVPAAAGQVKYDDFGLPIAE